MESNDILITGARIWESQHDSAGQSAMPLSRDWIVGDEHSESSVAGTDDDGLKQALGTLRRMVRT